MKTVAVIQSNYIPWKGYFDIIHDVDLFVFYDDVQFTVRDWRNRNVVKTAQGPRWLTVPVGASRNRLVCEVGITDPEWARDHWAVLKHHYSRAPFFAAYAPLLEDAYLGQPWTNLSALNHHLIQLIARQCLGIRTEFCDSREFGCSGSRQDRLIELLTKAGAAVYVSGPAARSYIDEHRFEDAGIAVAWKSYEGYPEYPQPHPPFSHHVTVLDLLFQVGPSAPDYIWGWRATDGVSLPAEQRVAV
jgi:hypothetical protein